MSLLVLILVCLTGSILVQWGSTYMSGRNRLLLNVFSAVSLGVGITILLSSNFNVWSLLAALAGVYLAVNAARAVEGRMYEAYLQSTVRRSTLLLGALLMLAALMWHWQGAYDAQAWRVVMWLCAGLAVIATSILLGTALWRAFADRFPAPFKHYSDKELPTVTVALPVRNETGALADALEAILASDYPKLEVLVLDDCSQDKTAAVIRGYAQAGVRFVQGDPAPADHWLPKNFAYEQLLAQASGQYILYCGADVRLEKHSIRAMVSRVLALKLEMMDVLPSTAHRSPAATAVAPLRAWWQVALPKEVFGRAPAIGSCWLIKRSRLKQLGGFKSVSRAVTPESWLARQLLARHAYRFISDGHLMGVWSAKTFAQQYQAALRTAYPAVRRRPERVLAQSVFSIALLLLPFLIIFPALQNDFTVTSALAAVASFNLILLHAIFQRYVHPVFTVLSLFTFPLSVIIDIVLLNWSMYRYEFGTVDWKGRNVCPPVMHVIPHLPPLK